VYAMGGGGGGGGGEGGGSNSAISSSSLSSASTPKSPPPPSVSIAVQFSMAYLGHARAGRRRPSKKKKALSKDTEERHNTSASFQ